jgi:hypothetical protein
MKMISQAVLAILAAVIFSGCAGTNTSDYDSYARSYDKHQEAKKAAIVALTVTAADAMKSVSDPTAKILYQILTQQQIVAINEQRFDLTKPTTMWDFWSGLWPFLERSVPIAGMAYGIHILGESTGHNNYVQADTITDSFSPVENHITGSSQSSVLMDYSKPSNLYNGPVTQQ